MTAVLKLIGDIKGGGTPSFDACVQALLPLFPLFGECAATPQDSEWHAEGDVYIHTGMVLDELYKVLKTTDVETSADERLTLIFGALLHDICKPVVTTTAERDGRIRTIAPKHEERGRAYVALPLLELGLPYRVVRDVMALVGYHQVPKQLVIKERPVSAFLNLARKAPVRLLYLLEQADMRGRICPDLADHLTYLELFRMQCEELGIWREEAYAPWRARLACELGALGGDFVDLALGQAAMDHEAGRIAVVEEALARSYKARQGFAKLFIMVGPSGSGKTTWIRSHMPEARVVSLDDMREEMTGSRSDRSMEGQARQEAKRRLKEALAAHETVVWDATSLVVDFRRPLVELGLDYGALVTLVVMHKPTAEVLAGNAERDHVVPGRVLQDQLARMQWPEEDEAHRLVVVGSGASPLYRVGFTRET